MGNLADRFGGKRSGELIQARDWNGLIEGIEAIESALTARAETLEARVGDLDARVGSLETGLGDLRTTVDLLLGQARRVSLSTDRVRYAIGELAEITARVADARGNPLDLASEATRPWVDFVSSWGHLRPVTGFRSIGGTGDRTLSVQVSSQGEARVLLRAEHAEGFTPETEGQVSTTLTTVLPATNKSVLTTILEASTPMEADLRGAFQVMTREYDRIDTVNVRDYVDTYFVRNPARVVGQLPAITHENWRDYRSTVLAFLKGDSDPSTAEPGQGVCSIQVTFRDWIGPWINLDYLPKAKDLAKDFGNLFQANVGRNFAETTNKFRDKVSEQVRDKGLIGKQRDYQAAYLALDGLSGPAAGPRFVGDAARSVQSAIGLQQTLETSEATLFTPATQVGLHAVTQVAVQADTSATIQVTGLLREQVGGLEERIQQSVQSVRGEVSGFQAALNQKADIQSLTRFLR
jgi:hypothetical protein